MLNLEGQDQGRDHVRAPGDPSRSCSAAYLENRPGRQLKEGSPCMYVSTLRVPGRKGAACAHVQSFGNLLDTIRT